MKNENQKIKIQFQEYYKTILIESCQNMRESCQKKKAVIRQKVGWAKY